MTGETWFKVGDIVGMKQGAGVFQWVQRNGLAEHPSAFLALDRLWNAVNNREVISYFEDESDSIDRVLEIFVRTNSGGTVLSKSDLLLSVATAQFNHLDARSAVHGLVDDLNAIGSGFSFTKDNVLKAALLITDRTDVRFSADAFTTENVEVLEDQWQRVEESLRLATHLLASFGYSERTLLAASVLLPLADYVSFRGLGETYLTSAAYSSDREAVRQWVTAVLLKQGIWGSALDTLLLRIRRAVRDDGQSGFPVRAIEREMRGLGKSTVLTDSELEELVEVKINNRRAFPLLALLYPGVNTRNEFHVDHVFPKAMFSNRSLGDALVERDRYDEYQDLRDRMPNLQLLEGSVNLSKSSTMPLEWVAKYFPDPAARSGWLAANGMTGLPDDMRQFPDFYERRRAAMLHRLVLVLGGSETDTSDVQVRQVLDGPSRQSRHSIESRQRPRQFGRQLRYLPDGPIFFRHRGVEHKARVVGDTIELANGERFDSPSGAASALNGGSAVNGWRAWMRDGRTIAEIYDS